MRDVSEYMNLPYTILVRKDDEGDYVARVEELDGCTAHGATKQEAIENLEEVERAWIAECIESNLVIPEPRAVEGLPSGRWVQRVPKSLHRKLVRLAKTESSSLNQLVTGILAEAVGVRSAKVFMADPASPPSYYSPGARAERGPAASVNTVLVFNISEASRPQQWPAHQAQVSAANDSTKSQGSN